MGEWTFTYCKNNIGIKILDIGIIVYNLDDLDWMCSTEPVCKEYLDAPTDELSMEDTMWILSDAERFEQFKMIYNQKLVANTLERLND